MCNIARIRRSRITVKSQRGARDELSHFCLSTEIQTSPSPPPVDPMIAHDQADPRARDLGIGQIDILPDQLRALAMCINQPSARSIVPIEQEIETVACTFHFFHFGLALFPFVRGISRNRGVRSAIPPAGPGSFDCTILVGGGRPWLCF